MGGVPVLEQMESAEELTILILGTDPLGKLLSSALAKYGYDVEVSKKKDAVDMVTITAPDLVLLVGDAALNGGKETLQQLAEHDSTWVTPVVVIGSGSNDTSTNYCRGAIAFLPRILGVKRLTERIRKLGVGISERSGDVGGEVSYEKIVALIKNLLDEQRSGVLSVEVEGETQSVSLVFRAGMPISEDASKFVARIRSKLVGKKLVKYQFSESSSGRVDSLSPPKPEDKKSLPILQDRRLLVVDSEYERANALASALQLAGAQAIALTPQTADFKSASQIDPEVVLISPQDLEGPCKHIMDIIQQDRRMRWATKLLAPRDEVWPKGAKQPLLSPIAARIARLIKPAEHLAAQLRTNRPFDTRLEILGPGRLLRILAESNRNLKVNLKHPRLSVEIELIDGRMHTIKGLDQINKNPLDNMAALSALLVVNSGRIHVEQLEPNLRLFNMGVGDAFTEAAAEQPPIRPSFMAVRQPKKPEIPPTTEAKRNDPKIRKLQPLSLFTPGTKNESPSPIGQVGSKSRISAEPALEPNEAILAMGSSIPALKQTDEANERNLKERAIESAKVNSKEPNSSRIQPLGDRGIATSAQSQSIVDLIGEVVDSKSPSHFEIDIQEAEPIDSIEPSPVRVVTLRSAFSRLQKSVSLAVSRTRAFAAGPALNTLRASMNTWLSRTRGFAVRPNLGRLQKSAIIVYSRVRVLALDRLPGSARQKTIAAGIVGAFLVLLLVVRTFSSDDEAEASVSPLNRTEAKTASTAVSSKTKEPESIAIQRRPKAEPRGNRNGLASKGKEREEEATKAPQQEEPSDDIGETELASTISRKSDELSSLEKARVMVNNALRLRRQNRLGMAETYYLKALKIRPVYPRAMAGIVRIHLERKDGTEALRWAKRIVALQPKSSYNRLLLGDAYALNGDKKRARQAWESAAKRGNKRARKRLGGR